MNCDQHTLATFNNFYYKEKTKIEKQGLKSRRSEEEEKDLLIGEKGKQKETRKRKNFAA
ncbi:hypothetical protein K501DRAFT_68576 [Backusella circina FSU 941]|nr:hypothetical protein K501DRAFT_68576 [Backusella circina FSU 941]